MSMPRAKHTKPADGRKRRRDDPPGMDWRQGKPIWIPGPGLRRAGWKSIMLKAADGNYLPRGLARVLARAINADVEKWRANPERADLTYTPGEPAARVGLPGHDDKTLENAFQRWRVHRLFQRLSPATRRDYIKKLSGFLAWAGSDHPLAIDRAMLTAFYEREWDRIFAMRALGWSEQEVASAPRERGPDGAHYITSVRAARWDALDEARLAGGGNVAGLGQVNSMIRVISSLYGFIDRELNWVPDNYNPAARFKLTGLKPRLVLPTDDQLGALVDEADAMGLHSVGDALVILANAGPRPADMVAWSMQLWRAGRIEGLIRKTHAHTSFKFPAVLARRMAMIEIRRNTAEATGDLSQGAPDLILITEAQQVAYTVNRLNGCFDTVRQAVAERMPEVLGLTPYDFRKMAITRLHAADNSRDAIAQITGHSFATIDTILDHYIVPTAEVADGAVDRLDEYMEARGVKW